MSDDNPRPDQLPPFRDRYTAAMSDLSPGGVLSAMDELESRGAQVAADRSVPPADGGSSGSAQDIQRAPMGTAPEPDWRSAYVRYPDTASGSAAGTTRPWLAGLGSAAGALLIGLWIYRRRRVEARLPVNRARSALHRAKKATEAGVPRVRAGFARNGRRAT